MRARGGGRIVNIGAIQGRAPDPAFFATSVNRAAGNSFTKTLALEVARDNILVNGVNIGYVVTPQWENIHQRRAPGIDRDHFFAQLGRQEVPLGRFGTPEEVAGIVVFLLSERASFITGTSIDVAGGMGRYV
jgi:NAD(P)-dependent dehydrogenase (short-subunit alcohol dehydrogenase family)